jgi:hypothetical protein
MESQLAIAQVAEQPVDASLTMAQALVVEVLHHFKSKANHPSRFDWQYLNHRPFRVLLAVASASESYK